jgi:hypothetical protein
LTRKGSEVQILYRPLSPRKPGGAGEEKRHPDRGTPRNGTHARGTRKLT